MAISQHFSREERKYSFRKNDMRVKKPGEPIQKCNRINIFIVHTEKKQHAYVIYCHCMTCIYVHPKIKQPFIYTINV